MSEETRTYRKILALTVVFLVWAILATGYLVLELESKRRIEARLAYLESELSKKVEEIERLSSNVTALMGKVRSLRGVLEEKIVVVDILIDYGNGTRVWYNDTEVLAGSTLLEATMKVARVEGETTKYGFYVKAINGVWERKISSKEGYAWMWYYWEDGEWVMGPTACDAQEVVDGGVYMWRYEHWKY